jgi:hypothetical protein
VVSAAVDHDVDDDESAAPTASVQAPAKANVQKADDILAMIRNRQKQ